MVTCTADGTRAGGGEEGAGQGAHPAAMAVLAVGETKKTLILYILSIEISENIKVLMFFFLPAAG